MKMTDKSFNALQLLEDACAKHLIRLDVLVAETALWASPETHRHQLHVHGSAAVFPKIRRARLGQGEKRGVKNKEGLDDNSYANVVIKRALGMHRKSIVGFECCHIWPNSCYDTRYHTAIANLVLIPRALASLTDHNPEIQTALQYRAYELYGWHPEEKLAPEKPENYPYNWRSPQPYTGAATVTPARNTGEQFVPAPPLAEEPIRAERIYRWACKPGSKVHSIIAVACQLGRFSRQQLVQKISWFGISKNPYGAIASLMSNKGNAYGLVFIEDSGTLSIHPGISDEIQKFKWTLPS